MYASGEDRRSGRFSVPGQQIVDAFGRVIVDAGKDIQTLSMRKRPFGP